MKTPIRRLDSLTHNDTAATKLINDNFEALQQGIEDALSRSGKTPNFMDAELDMNMHRIINIADPVDDYDLANKHYVDEQVAAEALARQSADNTLQQHIDDEATARQNADSTLQGNIDAEETRAKAAEKAITDTLDTYGDIVTHDADEFATAAQGAKADTAVQPGDLGNGTITITQGGVVKGTFTTNQAGNTTIEVDEGSAPVVTNDTVYIESVAITSQPGTSSGHVDVTSYVDPDKMYYPLLQINGHSFVDIKKAYYNWCVFRKNDSVRTVALYKVDPDVMVSAYFNILLIPIETDPSTVVVEGLSDGLGGTGSEIVIDEYPTEGSTNAVSSGGVYEVIDETLGNIEEALQLINSSQGSASAQEIVDATNNVEAIIESTEDQPIPTNNQVIAESIEELENILGDNNE